MTTTSKQNKIFKVIAVIALLWNLMGLFAVICILSIPLFIVNYNGGAYTKATDSNSYVYIERFGIGNLGAAESNCIS